MKSVQQAQANYQGSFGRAQTDWVAGINAYAGDWAGATVNQQAALVTNFNQAVSNGSWRNGVLGVGTQGWKSAVQAKEGAYGIGLNAGVNKFNTAISKILAAEANIVNSLPPRGTYEQNKLRATALMDGLHALKGTLGA